MKENQNIDNIITFSRMVEHAQSLNTYLYIRFIYFTISHNTAIISQFYYHNIFICVERLALLYGFRQCTVGNKQQSGR